jgi:hypothetical protein
MPNIFEVIDPRGRRVICTEEVWNDHVLYNHPWMDGREEEVKAAIQKPSFGIYQDAGSEHRHVYYHLHKSKRYYIKVVVEFVEDTTGKVITAFNPDSTKAGERLIWPESSI